MRTVPTDRKKLTVPRLTITDLSPRHQAEVAKQLERGKPIGLARAEQVRTEDKPRIRQSAKPRLNKTEAAFSLWLREHKPEAIVLEQAIALRLGNGVRFTVDFVTVEFAAAGGGRVLTAYETKGFLRDDAAVKLKVAASLYPWMRFVLVSRRRDGTWSMQEVQP